MKMKNRNRNIVLALTIMLISIGSGWSQDNSVIFKAMQDELSRNMTKLRLAELNDPFFISYTLVKSKQIHAQASLGGLIRSKETISAKPSVRLMVGDYHLNDENFSDQDMFSYSFGRSGRGNASIENDYQAIRRAFWLQTDEVYKSAAEAYEKKISALETQNISEELKELDDYSKADPVELVSPTAPTGIDKTMCESMTKELSNIFIGETEINSSNISIHAFESEIYLVNSEGTKTKSPLNLVYVIVKASVQAPDGVEFKDEISFFGTNANDLPSKEKMKQYITEFKDRLIALKTAPVLESTYNGPIYFEDEAVADLFINSYFKNSALVAQRDKIYSNPQMSQMNQSKKSPLADKIDEEIMSTQFSIYADATIDKFENHKLIGHYKVDAEGVVPVKTTLVENGILKTFLNNRIPTQTVDKSNGHHRHSFSYGSISMKTGPGVIFVNNNKVSSKDKLMKLMRKTAKKSGSDYFLLVEKIKEKQSGGNFSFFLSGGGSDKKEYQAFYVYKVSVKDGKKELIRPVDLKNIDDALEEVAGASESNYVYNTMLPSGGFSGFIIFSSSGSSLSGIPASFILPGALAFEKIKVEKEKILSTEKLPVVSNPVQ